LLAGYAKGDSPQVVLKYALAELSKNEYRPEA